MRNLNTTLQINLRKSLMFEMLENPIVHDFNIEEIIENLIDWQLDCLNEEVDDLILMFEPEMLAWLVTHIDTLDLLISSNGEQVVQLLQLKWDNSSFEQQIDLTCLYNIIRLMNKRQLRVLAWYCSKKI